MNQAVDGAIIFKTAAGSKLDATVQGAIVAFEVDGFDVADRSGWSVVAVGHVDVIDLGLTFRVSDAGV